MDTIISISSEQPKSHDEINIFESAGSIGNSTIKRPLSVSRPVLSKAPEYIFTTLYII